jgi:hypothetical protein
MEYSVFWLIIIIHNVDHVYSVLHKAPEMQHNENSSADL